MMGKGRFDDMVGAMTPQERKDLLDALRRAIAEETAARSGDPGPTCPRCRSDGAWRKGRRKDGSQRWLCRSCGKTYCGATGSLLGMSKLPAEVWMEFAACMVDSCDLRTCASRCGVELSTAWYMRMRLCEVMASRLAPFRGASGLSVEVDGTYLAESFKGDPLPPRPSRHHGGEVHKRGISDEQVCVLCGANDLGDAFCEPVCLGEPTDAVLLAALDGKVSAGASVDVDGHLAYPRVLPRLGASATRHVGKPHELPLVGALHSSLKRFLSRFCGVSTKRLPRYLAWFLYERQTRSRGVLGRDAYWKDASSGTYSHTRSRYRCDPWLFREAGC